MIAEEQRFHAQVRLAGSLSTDGTPEAWRVLTLATKDYAETVGQSAAFDAMDADVLTVALQALVNQRVFQPEALQGKSSEIIGLSPDGSTLVVAQDGNLLLFDALTSELRERLAVFGRPFLNWPIGEGRIGLVVCNDSPCILQEALSAHSSESMTEFPESYAEYMGLAAKVEFWELLDDFASHIREDIGRGKLNVVILDAIDYKVISFQLLECGDHFCIGSRSGSEVRVDLSRSALDE